MELIDRISLIKSLNLWKKKIIKIYGKNHEYVKCIKEVVSGIKTSKEVDAIPVKHGKWLGKPLGGFSTVRCSVCRNVLLNNDGTYNYCPYCGALMDER